MEPALMYDLRARTLSDQALGAIHDHAQNTVEPTEEQLAIVTQRATERAMTGESATAPDAPPGLATAP